MKQAILVLILTITGVTAAAEPVPVEITGTIGERWASTSEGWLERCYNRGRQDLCQIFQQGSEIKARFAADPDSQPTDELWSGDGWYYTAAPTIEIGFGYESQEFIWQPVIDEAGLAVGVFTEWRNDVLNPWGGYTYDSLLWKGRELAEPFNVNGYSFDRILLELHAFAAEGETPDLLNTDSEGQPLFPTDFSNVDRVTILLGSSCPNDPGIDICGDMIRLDLLTTSDERSFTFSGNVIFGDRIERAADGQFEFLPLREIPYGSAANVEFNLNAASFDKFRKDEDWASAESRAEYELGSLGAKWEFPEFGLSLELPTGMLIVSDNYECAADFVCDEISLYSESPSFLGLNATSGNTYLNQRGNATESTLIDSDQVPAALSVSETDFHFAGLRLAENNSDGSSTEILLGIGNIEVISSDDDGDGVPNDADTCPATAEGEIVDLSGCSVQQSCPCENNWKNHGQMVSCTSGVAEIFVSEGLLTDEEKDAIVSEAAQSSCGKSTKGKGKGKGKG